MDDLALISEGASGRLFFLALNASDTTLTTTQAIGLVLGLSALAAGLLGAIFFLFSGGNNTNSGMTQY